MASSCSLKDVGADNHADGDAAALDGFTLVIPFAVAGESSCERPCGCAPTRIGPDLECGQPVRAGWAGQPVLAHERNPSVELPGEVLHDRHVWIPAARVGKP